MNKGALDKLQSELEVAMIGLAKSEAINSAQASEFYRPWVADVKQKIKKLEEAQ